MADPYTQLLQTMTDLRELVFQLAETHGITRDELIQRATQNQETDK